MMAKKQIFVVLGMHRSGTSVITRGLQALGVDLGPRLLPPEAGINDKGFWEDIDITAFDVDLLKDLGHDWHTLTPILEQEMESPAITPLKLRAAQLLRSRLTDTDVFGLKDPRMARLMPFWLQVFEHLQIDASFVVACRNPMNVAHSLAKRDGFALEKGYLLWFEHMLQSVKHTEQYRRIFVDYDLMLSNPQYQLERISSALGLPFSADNQSFLEYRNEFLELSLRHNDFVPKDLSLDTAAPEDVRKLSELLSGLVNEQLEDDETLKKNIDNLHGSMIGRHPVFRLMRSLEDRAHGLTLRLEEAEMISARLAAQVNEAHSLNSQTQEALAVSRKEFAESADKLHQQIEHTALQSAQLREQQASLTCLEKSLDRKTLDAQQLAKTLSVSNSVRGALKNLLRAVTTRLQAGRIRRELHKGSLFNADYYRTTYPDVAAAGVDPLEHYLNQGWHEGRNPSLDFSTTGYLDVYSDVRSQAINPLLHYYKHGNAEGRAVPTTTGAITWLPPRKMGLEQIKHIIRALATQPGLAGKFITQTRRMGFRHAWILARNKLRHIVSSHRDINKEQKETTREEKHDPYNIVPYYLNPHHHEDGAKLPAIKIGIHLHLFYDDMTDDCIRYLSNIPLPFDLYLSIPKHVDLETCTASFTSELPLAKRVIVEQVPNRGRDLAPLIIQFGQRLTNYDVIAHFHTKKSPHKHTLNGWFDALMRTLCGSHSNVYQILHLLTDDAKVVYPAGHQIAHWDSSGWSDNQEIAKTLLTQYTDFDVADFQQVEFPQGSMFWAKSAALREFLTLPLAYNDFDEEPIAEDATLAHALERLILVFPTQHKGRSYRLESAELSDEPQHFYEEQHDFSNKIADNGIKVLAYYLPQFHPTPENDRWHGAGFTEWHKVAAANPLFKGHFQQHIPHPDIGYYHLESPEQLIKQSEMMRQSGVHGLIFYHYWFTGKLILEKPAQMLLDNPEINMPFSFCWANENWTRRWDGNEKEILLGQTYSVADAAAFVHYLIPFFKDERYIKIEGRPVLFIYRPSAIEHIDDYLRVWREECELNGLPAPYIVATLTRGAVSPAHYGMDAAVERVLHDWTGGNVADIRHELSPYWPLNGSVLDYSEVADHYMHKELHNDYTLFRSLVPTWDNTARYGSEAILLHRFTTPKFQEWLEHLIRYSVTELPADRRFVVVNAWNEWAEGAHLEPDTQFGYSYLNSIGRALCNYNFNEINYLEPQLSSRLTLRITLTDDVKHQLISDSEARRKFLHCLGMSTILQKCTIAIDEPDLANELATKGIHCTTPDLIDYNFTLNFDTLYLFPSNCIELLLLTALRYPGFKITPSVLNSPDYLHNPQAINLEVDYWLRAGMEITSEKNIFRGYKVALKAACFRLFIASKENISEGSSPQISTIMRFHRQGSLAMLTNALLSLMTQADCRVRLNLAVQDLDTQDMARLNAELAQIPWSAGCDPIIRSYHSTQSNPDLRSLMLNETLKAVGSGYVAFLDYDDVLFPEAYRGLVGQLEKSGKNASFARVYKTRVDARTGMILKRDKTYEYGFSYEEFIKLNHAPLHSFMLNLDKIDLSTIHYYEDMKFMEDYYLTLQLFSQKNTDWVSLRNDNYIGDYIHRTGGASNTLALNNDDERRALLKSTHYVECEKRITELRRKLTTMR